MKSNYFKKGIRVLGVAESFVRDFPSSVLAGVVMRGDFYIDGISLSSATVGGMDATRGVIELFKGLARDDLNVIFINGSVISWFNIIDLKYLAETIGVPMISLSYKDSDGLEEDIMGLFEDWEDRLKIYRQLGDRTPIKLHTGYEIFVRSYGLKKGDEKILLDRFTLQGKVPEPLRTAKNVAKAVLKHDIASHRKFYQFI